MRLITIILSLFLCTTLSTVFCQTHVLKTDTAKHSIKKKSNPSLSEMMKRHKNYYDDCVFNNRYSIKQRLLRYPFSKAAKVVAVSYRLEEPNAHIIIDEPGDHKDSISTKANDTIFNQGLHISDGVLTYSSLKEIKVLNPLQVNRLTDIIYNTEYKVHEFNSYKEGECFDPRNAIIFYDKSGKVFDYVQICFECMVSQSESDKITIGTNCNQKYDLLKNFFISLGIKYGTIQKN